MSDLECKNDHVQLNTAVFFVFFNFPNKINVTLCVCKSCLKDIKLFVCKLT